MDSPSLPYYFKQASALSWWNAVRRTGKWSSGNTVQIFSDGDECANAMLSAIAAANKRVWLESYIFDDSKLARAFVDGLIAARERGCDVVLLVDAIGSFSLPSSWREELRNAGADVVLFNCFHFLSESRPIGPMSYRDHRKILIADSVGFCGSFNIAHEAGGAHQWGSGHFFDVHAQLSGPAVADLAEVFCDSLLESFSGITRDASIVECLPCMEGCGGVPVQVMASNVRRARREIQQSLRTAASGASKSVEIASAYFYPPGFLRRALLAARRNGACVSLVLSGNSDIIGDVLASTYVASKFLRPPRIPSRGSTEVFFYQKQHQHAKFAIFDRSYAVLGSFNWDRYSSRRNLEVAIGLKDSESIEALRQIHADLRRPQCTRQLTSEQWLYSYSSLYRLVAHGAYYLVKLTGKNVADGLSNQRQKAMLRRAYIDAYLDRAAASTIATSMMWGL